ncbi:TPA: STY4526/YPO1902 family pathogenicity island replication protein, partial [Klebsiella quasipneumoniae]
MIPSLNYAVLTNALQALNEGNIRHCEDLGFTFDEMNALSQLSPDALFTLSRAAAPFIAVSLRHDVLHQLLAHSGQEEQRRQLIDRAIRLGGSIA